MMLTETQQERLIEYLRVIVTSNIRPVKKFTFMLTLNGTGECEIVTNCETKAEDSYLILAVWALLQEQILSNFMIEIDEVFDELNENPKVKHSVQ
jgi:hypothetical protein